MEDNIIKRNRQQIVFTLAGITLVLIVVSGIYTVRQLYIDIINDQKVTAMTGISDNILPYTLHEKIITITPAPVPKNGSKEIKETNINTEESIFTYLQGPRSWEERLDWSGPWGKEFYDGGSFGGFGCGLCCLANIYSTWSSYQCTPVDMYKFTRKNTGYGGGGAIAWKYMYTALKQLGFTSELKQKPSSYSEFKKQIAESESSIILVSSSNSKCYWKNTPGHYVTIFLYDKESDTVFLADSGDPSHNRQRVELRKIYKSLKTASEWQYLTIGSYDNNNDTWKHKKADDSWVQPGYIK